MCDYVAFQFKCRIAGIVGRTFVGLSVFVDTLGNVRGSKTGNGLYFSEQVVQHIAPVTKHVYDNAAVIFLAVVP
ncbi:hypothetical protein D3C86_2119160 [compost metagenome]